MEIIPAILFFTFLLLLVGRYFYRLAGKYGRNKTLYGFIGAGIGALSILIYFITIFLLFEFESKFGEAGSVLITFGPVVVSFGIIFVSYQLIRRYFKKNPMNKSTDNILDT